MALPIDSIQKVRKEKFFYFYAQTSMATPSLVPDTEVSKTLNVEDRRTLSA